ncbi:hypothetical protein [Halorubrum tropicale]|nr:hypothetical protein [Halorubrum tropicale]
MSENFEKHAEELAEKRDVFETIVETDGPFKPHAENILTLIDEWERGEL